MSDKKSESDNTLVLSGDSSNESSTTVRTVPNKNDNIGTDKKTELSDTESVQQIPPPQVPSVSSGRISPTLSETGSVRSVASSIRSGLRQPSSRIGRPCCTGAPKPPVPSHFTPAKSDVGRRTPDDIRKKATDASVVLTSDTDSFIIGDRVWVGGTKPGHIAYIGETQFAPGEWAGIVLDEPIGKNDGSVANIRYFQCENKKGVFSRLTRLTREPLTQSTIVEDTPVRTIVKSYASNTAARAQRQTSPTNSVRGSSGLLANRGLNTSNTSLASMPAQIDFKIGDRVIVRSSATTGSKAGIVRYIGTTEFAPGEWCGVELDDPIGKNDGSVDGISYFDCQPFYGLFTPVQKVSKSPSPRRTSTCAVHPRSTTPSGGIRRSNSRESLTSSIASSVRTTQSSRVRLGVTSLNATKNFAKVY